jgi:hypothetical protein
MSEDILDAIDSTLADVSLCFCGCKKALRATSPSPWFASEECQARWGARQLRAKSGIEKEAVAPEAAADLPPTTWTVNPDPVRYRCRTCGSWLSLDVALCGPCDARPKCSATPVAAATVCFLPAGHSVLHEDVEGRRWRVAGRMFEGAPMHPGPGRFTPLGRAPFLGPALDSAMDSVTQDLAAALDELVERAEAEVEVHRYECPHARCDWAKVALDRGVLLDLAEAHELEQHDPRSWWRRMLPGGNR